MPIFYLCLVYIESGQIYQWLLLAHRIIFLAEVFQRKQEDIDSGTVGLINTPKGVLVTQR
ncbi:hypothetical protein O5833_28010, partial [Escherichia coli]|nr:hypothetical protein [Escherichia coli]